MGLAQRAVVRRSTASGIMAGPDRRVDAALIERFSARGTMLRMHYDTITPIDSAWQERALCAQTGADFFFPEPGSSVREAKRICGMCEMRTACLEYALSHDERFGVWGGLSEKERLRLRRAENG
ncbi:WhiB family redox-sensing transcriptional regulator [Streptomyces stelliscabiei]|uniref:Transcriptional regulator WhiB n=1 Tax=Streptomyces stelliscabiei TaxID=146820 RepID=A0A8I0P8F0_9ACTN|nr:WhiB family redox-sensing transcriptional regulator [Streptomyces stelliscabiei]